MKGLSVIVVTHRKGSLLANTLRGLLPQLQPQDEAIIVDDGGEDRAVAQTARERFPDKPIRYLAARPHRGYRLALMSNLGVELARNAYCIKIDGDCIPQEGFIEAYRQVLGDELACGRVEWLQARGEITQDMRFDYHTHRLGERHLRDNRGNAAYPRLTWGGNIAFMCSTFLQLGGFLEEYNGSWGGEESDLGWRFYHAGIPIRFLFEPAVLHQHHPTNPYRGQAQKNLALVEQKRQEYAQGKFPPPVPPRLQYLQWQGWEAEIDIPR